MADVLLGYHAVVVLIAINAVLAYSMYAVLVAGQLSLAQAAFAAIAAYVTAVLSIETGTPLWAVLILGCSIGAVSAFLLGLPVLRLRGVFLAIATLGFGEVVRIVAVNLEVTGGAMGLRAIPKIAGLPHVGVVLVVTAWFFARLHRTRSGRAFAAVREDEIAAEAAGIDVVRYRMYSFIVSGAFAGCAGVLFAHFARFISPDQFGFVRALDALLYAIVGGTAHWSGPLVGAGFLTVLPEVQREFGFEHPWIRPAVSGTVLLLVILFAPGGLVGIGRAWGTHRGRRAVAASASSSAAGLSDEQPIPPSGDHEVRSSATVSDRRIHEPGRPAIASPSDDPRQPLVRLRDVTKDYGGVVALDHVDIDLRAGEIVGLIGPNGAGKTTLVNVLTSLTPPTSGTVHIAGSPLRATTRGHDVAALGVARTFQQVRLFEGLTVADNVLIGAHLKVVDTFARRLLCLPSARRDEASASDLAREALAVVGLRGLAERPATSLSYGDRRRLEIARALASRPQLLVLDEPAAGMNTVEALRLGTLIRRIAARGVTVLLIEHNVRLVMSACDRVIVLDFGVVIADGPPGEVSADPRVVAAYLGGSDAATTP